MSDKKYISKCMFCNSSSYGTGCPYSPHKKHVHTDDPLKCIYCGSSSIGTGCPYNPFGKMHIRGAQYNMIVKESLHKSMVAAMFVSRLTQPISEMTAFKFGLINENGEKLRDPESVEEFASLSHLDQYILKIRRLIGEDLLDLFKSTILLEMATKKSHESFDPTRYADEIKISSDLQLMVKNLEDIFTEASEKGFSKEYVENLLIESILKNNENQKNIN